MPLKLVLFQLPNMDIYFNKLLALALLFYVIYFFAQKTILNSYFKKEDITNKDAFILNRLLGVLRLVPVVIILFSMYNFDNQSLIDGLQYNECKELYNKMEWNSLWTKINGTDYKVINGEILNRTLMNSSDYTLYIPER